MMRLVDDTMPCDILARLGISQSDPKPATRPAQLLRDREILIVDDDAQRQFALGQLLQSAGAWVSFVALPRKAGFQAGVAAQSGRGYHLLIVNLDLPDVRTGGEAVLRRHGYEGPILGLCALTPRLARRAALAAGCAAHLPTDASSSQLLHEVKELARCVERPATTADGPGTEPLGSALASYPHLMTMLQRFLDRLPGQVEQLEAAAHQQDLTALRDLSERLKQTSASHGFDGLARRASELHHKIDAHEQLDDLAREAKELASLCRQARIQPIAGETPPLPPRA